MWCCNIAENVTIYKHVTRKTHMKLIQECHKLNAAAHWDHNVINKFCVLLR